MSTIMTTNPSPSNVVSYDIGQNRRRHLTFMQQTHEIIMHMLASVSQERATTARDARDGDKGWTVLEVLCHLRDFDNIFRMRAKIMRYQEYPTLPFYDHEKLAQEGNYNGQVLDQVIAEFTRSRQYTITFFELLSDDLWQRSGVHPERGHFTMVDAALQIGLHDVTHIEQMSRILYHNE
jgi:hypothetical protein